MHNYRLISITANRRRYDANKQSSSTTALFFSWIHSTGTAGISLAERTLPAREAFLSHRPQMNTVPHSLHVHVQHTVQLHCARQFSRTSLGRSCTVGRFSQHSESIFMSFTLGSGSIDRNYYRGCSMFDLKREKTNTAREHAKHWCWITFQDRPPTFRCGGASFNAISPFFVEPNQHCICWASIDSIGHWKRVCAFW